jgi:hypothetical protein
MLANCCLNGRDPPQATPENLGRAAADEADGVLPPAADIDVIKDLASGGTDEGRVMMQIIHEIAPSADLAFCTAFDSEQDFANGSR